ncbi:MAG: hypothetical protein BIP78_1153 [Candidatus Bipolaricaulis sibiricus]|uniref:Uncharacterized protein n=1 Tax=Bipolaricaulis sibiricus TaxID=2501609 RepID=A0A410FV10_BIPS1|nr:MAG: hypothetical protein BIP78_1153 [Candidatus Bipolaricaulis sibiricus]
MSRSLAIEEKTSLMKPTETGSWRADAGRPELGEEVVR